MVNLALALIVLFVIIFIIHAIYNALQYDKEVEYEILSPCPFGVKGNKIYLIPRDPHVIIGIDHEPLMDGLIECDYKGPRKHYYCMARDTFFHYIINEDVRKC